MDAFNEVLTKSPIVIDNGSGVMKAGFQGQGVSCEFNTEVGKPKYKQVLPSSNSQEEYVGGQIEENRGILKLSHPIDRGIVQDWQQMDLIWKHIYSELNANAAEYPVLLTEPALNPHNERMKMAQHFFEHYNTPALFIATQGVLSLFGDGKKTGISFECGEGVTQVVPVFDGYYLQHANQRIDLGGKDVTEHLRTLLRRTGNSFNTTAEWDIVKKIKEKKCELMVTNQQFQDDQLSKLTTNYVLPDGSVVELVDERNRAPEILFNPEIIGLEYPSVAQLLKNSIQKIDIDLRSTLMQDISMSGGTTYMQGFPDRFIYEFSKYYKTSKLSNVKPRLHVSPERNHLAWTGGSILSGLNYFKNMWITKQEFQEQGEKIFLKKSF